jgi:hypothetical protein
MRFEKQTYTQTPNSLFLEMKNMDECELKVVLLICRYTFGYHREEVKLSTRRIADEIGMNTASVQKGADSAIERGLIEKVIDGNKTTTWRALVSDSEIESQVIQKLNRGVSDNESLLGVKESIKKIKENVPFNSSNLQGIEASIYAGRPTTQADIDATNAQNNSGTAWRGRELLPPHYLIYADWWVGKTGLQMYGVKAKPKLDAEWLKACKELWENEVTIKACDEALIACQWKKPSRISQIVAEAKAAQAAGIMQADQEPQEHKFKDGSGYV